jgi:hypothetical protein
MFDVRRLRTTATPKTDKPQAWKARGGPSAPSTPVLSKAEEIAKQVEDPSKVVTIRAPSIAGADYKMAWQPGKDISKYLAEVNLIKVAAKGRVYDMKNLSAGRLRLYYVPEPGAIIVLGSTEYSPMANITRRMTDDEVQLLKKGGT